MTAPHLTPIPLGLVLALSKHVMLTGDLMQAVRTENLAFTCSMTPWDASRTAKALRFLITQAEAAALAFEAAAKTTGE